MENVGVNQNLIFRVEVQEGRGFGSQLHALVCSATFISNVKPTQFSVGRETHLWNTPLQWGLTKSQLRKASSAGQSNCKVVVSSKDGAKLGWFLLDLRKAKLNHQYKKEGEEQGEWFTLTGAKAGETPQVKVVYELFEEAVKPSGMETDIMSALDSKLAARRPTNPTDPGSTGAGVEAGTTTAAPPKSAARDGSGSDGGYTASFDSSPKSGGSASPGVDRNGGGHAQESHSPQEGGGAGAEPPGAAPSQGGPSPADGGPAQQPAATASAREGASQPNPGGVQQSEIDVAVGGLTPPLGQSLAVTGPHRLFSLSIDLRSFAAGRLLPINLASVYLQAVLPQGITGLVADCGRRLPSRMAPLKTFPSIDVARGSEGSIPNEFVAGVMTLAEVLATDPRITVEVWHKEK
eukprot:gene5677-3537_t